MKTVFENFAYTLKRVARAKALRIIIKPGGQVVVTAPKWLAQLKVREYVQSQQAWIAEKLAQTKSPSQFPQLTKDELARVKKMALRSFIERLKELNVHYNFVYTRVGVRDQSTRWGSCSKSGGLSFNYRLYFLRPELQDYVLVHELCHLKELNHSAKFWALMAETLPDFKTLRKELKSLQM